MCIKEVGFTLSAGKNYKSRNFLTINSRGFRLVDGFISEIQWDNIGLLTGISKLNVFDLSTKVLPLKDWYNTLMRISTNQVLCHELFLRYHSVGIKAATKNGDYNLFISEYLGGLGFKLYPHIDVHITNFQRKFALYNYNKLNTCGKMKISKFMSNIFQKLVDPDERISSMEIKNPFEYEFILSITKDSFKDLHVRNFNDCIKTDLYDPSFYTYNVQIPEASRLNIVRKNLKDFHKKQKYLDMSLTPLTIGELLSEYSIYVLNAEKDKIIELTNVALMHRLDPGTYGSFELSAQELEFEISTNQFFNTLFD
jgi:hypothetical protein